MITVVLFIGVVALLLAGGHLGCWVRDRKAVSTDLLVGLVCLAAGLYFIASALGAAVGA